MNEKIKTIFVDHKSVIVPVACSLITAYYVNKICKANVINIGELHIHAS